MIVEWPLTTRDEIIAAFKLGAGVASDSPFKTLRKRGVVSPGIRVVARDGGRLAGQHVFYSSLCLQAARLARHGHIAQAQAVCGVATELELLVSAGDVEHASDIGSSPPSLRAIALRTHEAAERFRELLSGIVEETSGVVASVDGETVLLATPSGTEWMLLRRTLPRELMRAGVPVVLITEWLGEAGALVTARRGVRLPYEGEQRSDPTVLAEVGTVVPVPVEEIQRLRLSVLDAAGSVAAEGTSPSAAVRADAERLSQGEVTVEQFVESVVSRYRTSA